MFQHFVNREEELELLEELYSSKKAEFIIIYGRRRVGKTELALKFYANKPAVYFLAEERRDEENLREFKSRIGEHLKDEWISKLDIKSWSELFKYISEKIGKDKLLIIIDEFPYLMKHNHGIASAFQKAWDLYLMDKKVMLIIIGSSISMMEKLLGYKSPLYGRRTAQLEVKPLKFMQISPFLPNYTVEDLIKVFSCVGGVPFYITQFDANKSLFQNIEDLFLRRGRFLYEEADFILKQEFREPANYFSILRAISFGYLKYGEIVSYTGLDKSIVSKYLDNLTRIRLVRKSYPLLAKKEKIRDIRYEMTDNYYRFWFRFIYPNKTFIEEKRGKEVLKKIEKEMNHYIGRIFEEIASEILLLKFDFEISALGRWWHKKQEIDIIALNEETKQIAFFECKWSVINERKAEKIIAELKNKAKEVKWHNKDRIEFYGIIAKKIKNKEELTEKEYLTYDLTDF